MLSQPSDTRTQEKVFQSPEVKIKPHETKNNKSESTSNMTGKLDDPTTRTTQQDDKKKNSQGTQQTKLEENQILVTDSIKSQTLQVPQEESHRSSVENYSSDGGSIRYEFDIMDTTQPEQETSFSNAYSTKKTVVQGMMDLALITANANQLRTLLEYGSQSATFELVVFCIVLSLCIQITVGLTLIVFRHKMHPPSDYKQRPRYIKRIDNFVLTGVFLVTVLNVFIAAFTTIQDHKISP